MAPSSVVNRTVSQVTNHFLHFPVNGYKSKHRLSNNNENNDPNLSLRVNPNHGKIRQVRQQCYHADCTGLTYLDGSCSMHSMFCSTIDCCNKYLASTVNAKNTNSVFMMAATIPKSTQATYACCIVLSVFMMASKIPNIQRNCVHCMVCSVFMMAAKMPSIETTYTYCILCSNKIPA